MSGGSGQVLQLDPPQLVSAGGQLEEDAGASDSAQRALSPLSSVPAPATGIGIGNTLVSFAGEWTEALGLVSADLRALTAFVDSAASAVQLVDADIAVSLDMNGPR